MPINVTDPIFSSNLVCLVHVYIITAMFKYNILYVAYPGYYGYITNYTCSFSSFSLVDSSYQYLFIAYSHTKFHCILKNSSLSRYKFCK